MATTTEKTGHPCSDQQLGEFVTTDSAAVVDSNNAGNEVKDDDLQWTPDKQTKLILAGQAFIVFVVALDLTILTATLPTVANALHANATQAFWIAASYLLANAVIQPLMAALSDVFGRRSIFFGAMVMFTVGTIVCCTAHNVAAMISGRCIQGVGGGGILSVNLIILSDLVPLRQRSKYQGQIQLVFALGLNLAPIIGGALIKDTWRWLFYINLPFCGIALIMIPFLLRYEVPQSTFYDKLSSIDWVGSGIFIVSMTVFLVGVSWGGNQFNWGSAATLVPLLLGIVGVVGTGLYEQFVAKTPFLRLSLFHSLPAVACYICTTLSSILTFAETYYLTLYLLSVKLYSPIIAGTGMLACGLVLVPVSGIVGGVIAKVGKYQWAIWSGWVISTLGCGVLIVLDINTSIPAWIFIFITSGIGQGLLLIAHSVAVQASCETKDIAYASSMYSFFRSLGLCLGVVLGGTVLQNLLRQRLSDLGLPTVIASEAEGFVPTLKAMIDPTMQREIREAYAWAFQRLFATLTGISGLGMLLSSIIGNHTLDKALESKHKLRKSQTELDTKTTV